MMLPHILAIATNHVTPLIVGVAQRVVAVFLSDELREKRKKPKISDSPSNSTNTNVNESLLKVLGEQQQRIADLKAQELDIQETALNIQKAIAIDNSEYREKLLALEHKKLRLQESMARVDRDFQAKQSALYRELLQKHKEQEIAIQLTNLQGYWDREKLPTILSRAELKSILVDGQQQLRLLMLLSKPEVSEACPAFLKEELGMEVENELKQFMQQRYPDTSKKSPVRFYSRFFSQAVFDLEIEQLRNILAPVPTAIIYSNVTSRKVFFHISFLGLSGHSTLNITESLDWRSLSQQLKAENPEISDETILCEICDLIVVLNKLLAAFLADLYYLIEVDPYYKPQLFQMDLGLPLEAATSFIQPYVDLLKEIQQQQLQVHEREIKMLQQAQVWKCVNTFTGFSDSLYSIEISPDGEILLGISQCYEIEVPKKQIFYYYNSFTKIDYENYTFGGITKIWNLNNKKLICTFSHKFDGFSPDGKLLFKLGKYGNINIWNPVNGKLLYQLSEKFHAFSIDGTLLITDSYNTIKIYNSQTGNLLFNPSERIANDYRKEKPINISLNNKLLAAGCEDKKIRIWDIFTGELLFTLAEHSSSIHCVTFSPDYELLASSDDSNIHIWNFKLQKLVHSISQKDVFGLTFNPDGQILVSSYRYRNSLCLWSSHTGENLKSLSFDAKMIFEKRRFNYFDMSSLMDRGTPDTNYYIKPSTITFNDNILLCKDTDNVLHVWNIETGEKLPSCSKDSILIPDKHTLCTIIEDETTGIWDLQIRNRETGKLLQTLPGHSGGIEQVVFSNDGQTMVSLGGDLTLKVWKREPEELLEEDSNRD
ncbi:MAG: hypothetical protein RMY62_001215 [Nostoc sp. ZfuVER08]|nr:hypothetical protein [Nostoc sp. ZfuVER08]